VSKVQWFEKSLLIVDENAIIDHYLKGCICKQNLKITLSGRTQHLLLYCPKG
jgi:hypothetical protein